MNKFLKNIKILAFSIVLCGEGTMSFLAYAAPAVKIVEEGFSVSGAGGHRYGSNGIGVWLSGRINIGLSDTIEMETNGVGVIENQLSPDDLKLVKDIHRELCTIGDEKPATELTRIDPPLTYSVTCMQDGSKKNSCRAVGFATKENCVSYE